MNKKIINSLNKIVPSQSQKDDMYNKILSRPNKKIGGYILKTCTMAACFMVTFMLFAKETSVDQNNNMPRTIDYNCETEECLNTFEEE